MVLIPTSTFRRLVSALIAGLMLALFAGGPSITAQVRNRPHPVDGPGDQDPSVFTVARFHYPGGGDWYWGTSAIPNLLAFIDENTEIPISTEEVRVKPSDDKLFDYPLIFATGHGTIRFSDEDILRVRRYLLGGGFWLINDSYGMDQSVRRELGRVFPDRELVELPFSHPIYHTPYEFPDGPPKIHRHDDKPPRGYAILDGDRVVVFYLVESDIGDGWEDPQVHKDPPAKRRAALEMGTNIVVYSLTH